MFFLLRMAFWMSVVLVLLPSGGSQHTATAPSPELGAAFTQPHFPPSNLASSSTAIGHARTKRRITAVWREHDHDRAHLHPLVEVGDVLVSEPNAA